MVCSILSILWEKKVILNKLGRIARSYEVYIRRDVEFFTVDPTVLALEDSIYKKLFKDGMSTPFVPIWDQIKRE